MQRFVSAVPPNSSSHHKEIISSRIRYFQATNEPDLKLDGFLGIQSSLVFLSEGNNNTVRLKCFSGSRCSCAFDSFSLPGKSAVVGLIYSLYMGIVCRRFFVLHSPYTWTLGCGFIEHVRVAIESATIPFYSSAVISPFLSLPFPYLPFPPFFFPLTTFHTPPPQERSQEHRTHAACLVNQELTHTNASGRCYRGHSTGSRGQFGP